MAKGNYLTSDRGGASISSGETTAGFVKEQLQIALDALRDVPGDSPSVPMGFAKRLATAHGAIDALDRYLPRVKAYALGYAWGSDGSAWTTWTAHATQEEAEAWLPHIAAKGREQMKWEIRFRGCELDDLIVPGTDPEWFFTEGNGRSWFR